MTAPEVLLETVEVEEEPAAPSLTLADVRARAAQLGETGGVWAVMCVYRYERYAELVGLFSRLGDAFAEAEAEIRREWEQHPHAELTCEEDFDGAWDLTVGTVIIRLEWSPVIHPRRNTARWTRWAAALRPRRSRAR